MILTGTEIEAEWAKGRLVIDPFVPEQVNPNSYNFRLGRTMRVYRSEPLDPRRPNEFDQITIPDEGFELEPGRLYLAHTVEVLGSDFYAPTFAARSSVARLGIFINLSANLGDIGYKGQWTLQLYALHRVRVYPDLNIGQMMWWRPQGEVQLYDGKYQSAVGPRSSDIYIDFAKKDARWRFPSLGATVDTAQVGPKFAALAASSRQFRVPPAFCVPAGEFTDALTPEHHAALAEAFGDLRATVGAFYSDSVARIHELGKQVRLPEPTRSLIPLRLKDIFGSDDGMRFAVRSSGIDEDTEHSSMAGVHTSVLDVPADEVASAIEVCWASYYQPPAVAARVRAGNYDYLPRLAVIVQQMVKPDIAGVAFTGLDADALDRVEVEYVEGLADQLVAGVKTPLRYNSDLASTNQPWLSDVVELARALRQSRGHPVDIEWAVDSSGVYLLQVRPLTARGDRSKQSSEPVAAAAPLYTADLPSTFQLGDTAVVYASYVGKRGPAYRLADALAVATGAGWVVQFNGLGLHDPALTAQLRAELTTGRSEMCVLDLGVNLRQIVLPKDEVIDRLVEVSGARPEGTQLHAAIVRDYLRGELGMISRLTQTGLIIEYTPQGLMALNRGTAGGETIIVVDLDKPYQAAGNVLAPASAGALLPHLADIARLTRAMRDAHGEVAVEWVFHEGRPYFVDYSVLHSDELVVSTSSSIQMSPGIAHGPLLRLQEDEMLSRLSIGPAVSINKFSDVSEYEGLAKILESLKAMAQPPIVFAKRPYAVLSVLFGHVAGFVFEEGSILGHLAILLREAGVPAVIAPGVDGEGEVLISDGELVLARYQKEEE